MEPPSPILKTSNHDADSISDDPLSDCVFMIFNNPSGPEDGSGERFVCAYTAHAGLLFLGITGGGVS